MIKFFCIICNLKEWNLVAQFVVQFPYCLSSNNSKSAYILTICISALLFQQYELNLWFHRLTITSLVSMLCFGNELLFQHTNDSIGIDPKVHSRIRVNSLIGICNIILDNSNSILVYWKSIVNFERLNMILIRIDSYDSLLISTRLSAYFGGPTSSEIIVLFSVDCIFAYHFAVFITTLDHNEASLFLLSIYLDNLGSDWRWPLEAIHLAKNGSTQGTQTHHNSRAEAAQPRSWNAGRLD